MVNVLGHGEATWWKKSPLSGVHFFFFNNQNECRGASSQKQMACLWASYIIKDFYMWHGRMEVVLGLHKRYLWYVHCMSRCKEGASLSDYQVAPHELGCSQFKIGFHTPFCTLPEPLWVPHDSSFASCVQCDHVPFWFPLCFCLYSTLSAPFFWLLAKFPTSSDLFHCCILGVLQQAPSQLIFQITANSAS